MALVYTGGATGGGGGGVASVTAGDTSIVVGGTAANPTVETATLDVIAADHPPAADWSNNSKKITAVADPTNAQDAATKAYADAHGPVASVFGRTGAVVAVANDYTDAQVASSPTNVLTATGDLLYASAANTLARLGVGSASQLLGGGTTPAWVLPPGYEIGYDQITSGVNITGTTQGTATAIISCSAHTFDGGPVLLTVHFPQVKLSTVAGNGIGMTLFESGSAVCDLAFFRVNVAPAVSHFLPMQGLLRFTPSAGSHTYTIAAYTASTTGTPAVGAGTGTGGAVAPAFARFTKA